MKIETGRRPGYTIVLSYTKVAKKKFEISDFFKNLFIYISTRWIDNKPCHIGYNFICSIRKKFPMTRGHELSLHPASEILGLGTSSLKVFSFFV